MNGTADPAGHRATEYPRAVHQLCEQWATQTPDVTAVECGDGRLTYSQLNTRANRLARLLRQRGVAPGDNVGIWAERSINLVVALLAILKAGASYVGLDPRHPRERHRVMLADAEVAVLLTEERLLADVGGIVKELLLLEQLDEELNELSGADLDLYVHPETPAYVSYTSGSTGVPKGVVIPHRAIMRLVVAPNFLSIGPADVVLHFAPIAFDASTFEIWAPLANGARLVIFPAYEPTLDQLAETVERTGVTVMWMTAGLFHQMVNGPINRLSNLRQLLAGGDVLSVTHVNKVIAALPEITVINGYGPTENTTFTCFHTITETVTSATVPIGRPINGTYVHVLDERLQPVPDGMVGELCTGGDGLAHGYLGQPEKTAERFVPDPYGPRPGARLYRTGDLVRRHLDGTVEFLGRMDNQVKIRGFRIEPGEVEAALLAMPEIRDATVVAQSSARAGRRLVAFFIAEEDVSVPELRRRLGAALPAYMVPAVFVRLSELPLNRNGKVDRSALREHIVEERPEVSGEYRAPRDEVERILAAMWADLMEIEEVGIDDDFFELGGHSLLAVQITVEIAAIWGVEVGLRVFYENPTVADLARTVEELRR